MRNFSLGTEVTFSAAHFLPGYDGPCSKIHGHTWRVEVEYGFPEMRLPADGMFVDFGKIKSIIRNNFDHTLLNDHSLLDNTPTAEKLAEVIMFLLPKIWGRYQTIWVTVWESAVSWVRVMEVFDDHC